MFGHRTLTPWIANTPFREIHGNPPNRRLMPKHLHFLGVAGRIATPILVEHVFAEENLLQLQPQQGPRDYPRSLPGTPQKSMVAHLRRAAFLKCMRRDSVAIEHRFQNAVINAVGLYTAVFCASHILKQNLTIIRAIRSWVMIAYVWLSIHRRLDESRGWLKASQCPKQEGTSQHASVCVTEIVQSKCNS